MSKANLVIEGHAYWAKVLRPEKGKYSIDICQLSNEMVERCLELGLKVKNGENDKEDIGKGNYVTARSKTPPIVIDANKEPFTEKFIGNGSKVKASCYSFDYDNEFGKGTSLGLNAVQVIDLVPYVPDNTKVFKVETGAIEPKFGD